MKQHPLQRLLILSTLLVISQAFLVSPAHAQDISTQFGLQIDPPLTQIVIQPGKTTTATLNLKNIGRNSVQITPKLVDFVSDQKTGVPVLQPEFTFPYLKVFNPDLELNQPFLLRPDQTQQLVFEITIPEDAKLLEYHFSALFESVTDEQSTLVAESETPLSGRIVSNFIVTISQDGKDQGVLKLEHFNTKEYVDSLGSINMVASVRNLGSTVTVTLGQIEIYNFLGQKVFSQKLMPENVLPESTRELHAAETQLYNGQNIEIPVSLKYKPIFLIGLYTIKLSFNAPTQETQIFEEKVWALPFSIGAVIILASTIIFMYSKTKLFNVDNNK